MLEQANRTNRTPENLFRRIGVFLDMQGLDPDPANYAFAYAVLGDPEGPLAKAVSRLIDGGFRLSRHEVAELGGNAVAAPVTGLAIGLGMEDAVRAMRPDPVIEREQAAVREADDRVHALFAETQAQVDDFAELVRNVQAEAHDFGRDLAQSADAIRGNHQMRSGDELAQLAASMAARVRDAEERLAQATEETDTLRSKLAEARDSARRDVLTGLPNRRAFEEAMATRIEAGGPYCLAICDIDRFKQLNDRHGHIVGDRVLRAVAQTLAQHCGGHLVVRHGGEEFAVLIAGLPIDVATHLIDGARASVAGKRFRNRDTDAPIGEVSFSAGITMIEAKEELSSAFDRADRLLYAAKDAGRNQVYRD